MPTTPDEDDIRALNDDLRRRQYNRSAPQKMADVLSGLLARRGYAQVESASNCEQAWQTAAGQPLASHSRPGNVRRGVLEVAVRNSAVLQELTFQKKRLLKELSRLAPEQAIRDLRFRVSAID